MPRITIDAKFSIGDRVRWEENGMKTSKCDHCGTTLFAFCKVQRAGEIHGWEAIEFGTMGIDLVYIVEPDGHDEDGHSHKRPHLAESRLSHAEGCAE